MYTNTFEYIYVYKKVLTVSTRKGTDIVWESHNTESDTPTYPWYDSWKMYNCEYMCMYAKGF